jgi:hypothetical protein
MKPLRPRKEPLKRSRQNNLDSQESYEEFVYSTVTVKTKQQQQQRPLNIKDLECMKLFK